MTDSDFYDHLYGDTEELSISTELWEQQEKIIPVWELEYILYLEEILD